MPPLTGVRKPLYATIPASILKYPLPCKLNRTRKTPGPLKSETLDTTNFPGVCQGWRGLMFIRGHLSWESGDKVARPNEIERVWLGG